ncbi:GNAT family N-acetyltransferase [Opitutus sp. ER46]|uniref:GNAT family N-acetyltransferase n=1 Tax=Opitutus sp. ER46 TaxID=2161864 RepID=UPI001304828F|nr:GNAT family N-acetyltransferase [Opitutus sp. ER46]
MSLAFTSLSTFGLEPAAAVLTHGFADYFVQIPFTAGALLQAARVDSVDLAESQIVSADGAAIGAALLARRGWTCRLAGMCLVPEARRRGAGEAFVRHLVAMAKARGDRSFVLEVIEQNAPAVALYRKCGFRELRRLLGFARTTEIGATAERASACALTEIDPAEMPQHMANVGTDWPWQISAATAAQFAPPLRAFRLGDAGVAVACPDQGDVVIRALGHPADAAGTRAATALLRALPAHFSGRRCVIKAVWPEAAAVVFVEAGFQRTELTQLQMHRALTAGVSGA